MGSTPFRSTTLPPRAPGEGKLHSYMAPEQRQRKRWPSRRSDIYSFGGVLFWLATGKNLSLRPPSKPEIISALNSSRNGRSLLKENCGIADIIARCLRKDRDIRTATADALLDDISMFDAASRRPGVLHSSRNLDRLLTELSSSRLFASLAEFEVQATLSRLHDMARNIVDITGDHERIASALSRYLSVLREGDEYLAVSIPHFWKTQNIGVRGRFLSMNRLLVERGVRVRRLFFLTRADRSLDWVRKIVRTHVELEQSLSSPVRSSMQTRFLEVSSKEQTTAMQSGKHRGMWIRRGEAISIIPVYSRGGAMRTVRLRRLEGSVRHTRQEFLDEFTRAQPLGAWLKLR